MMHESMTREQHEGNFNMGRCLQVQEVGLDVFLEQLKGALRIERV
jgi:hypothetical protein